MSDVITSILADETLRDDAVVETLLMEQAEAGAPWYDSAAE